MIYCATDEFMLEFMMIYEFTESAINAQKMTFLIQAINFINHDHDEIWSMCKREKMREKTIYIAFRDTAYGH